MTLVIASIAVWLVAMPILSALILRHMVAPKMPRGADGYSTPWQGEDGKQYRMDLASGRIVPA